MRLSVLVEETGQRLVVGRGREGRARAEELPGGRARVQGNGAVARAGGDDEGELLAGRIPEDAGEGTAQEELRLATGGEVDGPELVEGAGGGVGGDGDGEGSRSGAEGKGDPARELVHGLAGVAGARHAHGHPVSTAIGRGEGEELTVVAEGGRSEAAGIGGDGAGGARLGELEHGEVDARVHGEPSAIGRPGEEEGRPRLDGVGDEGAVRLAQVEREPGASLGDHREQVASRGPEGVVGHVLGDDGLASEGALEEGAEVVPLEVEHLDGAALLLALADDGGDGDGLVVGPPGGPEPGPRERRAAPAVRLGAEDVDGLPGLCGDDGRGHVRGSSRGIVGDGVSGAAGGGLRGRGLRPPVWFALFQLCTRKVSQSPC